MTNFQESMVNVSDLINGLMIVLSDKEKFIIEKRYSLNESQKMTLENIGKKFSVTRERIRQIEKNALRKLERNVNNTPLCEITSNAIELLTKSAGICSVDRLVNLLQDSSGLKQTINKESLKLSIELEKEIYAVSNTIAFKPYFKFMDIKDADMRKACKLASNILNQENTVIDLNDISKLVLKDFKQPNITVDFIKSSLYMDRSLKIINDTQVGLSKWRSINPKTLRDKISYVLNETKEPMHYLDISKSIIDHTFDKKNVNTQAVHNELIRHNGFVLIGRGIYALKEWGYTQGTVCDVIKSVLRTHGQLTRDEIVDKVLQKRKVKRITILLNLKNKPDFIKVGRNHYGLSDQ